MILRWKRIVTTAALIAAFASVGTLSACNGEKVEHTGTPTLTQVRRGPQQPDAGALVYAAVDMGGSPPGGVVVFSPERPSMPDDVSVSVDGGTPPGGLCAVFGPELPNAMEADWEGEPTNRMNPRPCE